MSAINVTDFSALTFTAKQVRDLQELIYLKVLSAGKLQEMVTISGGEVGKRKIGFIGGFGMVGTADKGCEPTADNESMAAFEKELDPTIFDVYIKQCAKDIINTLAQYAMRTGTDLSNLTGTDWEKMVDEWMTLAIAEMYFRKTWFDNKDAATISGGGYFKNGTDITKVNLINGLWKQIYTIWLSNVYADRNVTIAKNTQSTFAAQELGAGEGKTILTSLVSKVPAEVMEQSDVIGMMTESIYRQYWLDMVATINIESQLVMLESGLRQVTVGGIPFIIVPQWDRFIRAYEQNGTKYRMPHRALVTSKSNLLMATDATPASPFSMFQTGYNSETRYWYGQAQGRIDALVLQDNLMAIAL